MTRTALPFDPASVRHVLQRPQVDDFLGALGTHEGIVVLDIETTGLNEHWAHARVVTLSATLASLDEEGEEVTYPLTYVVGLSHPDAPLHTRWREELTRIARALLSYRLQLVGQNIRFDIRWITALTGINLSSLVLRDTGLSSHLQNENQTASLKPRAIDTFGIEKWIDFDWGVIEKQQMKDPRYPFCPLLAERVSYFVMAMYNARDTYWTWRLDQLHCLDMGILPSSREELMAMGDRDSTDALRLGTYYQTVGMPGVRTLIELEQTGMKIDVKWCHERVAELERIVKTNLEELRELWFQETSQHAEDYCKTHGVLLSFEPTALFFKEWVKVMCKAGKMRVLGMTPEGEASWTKEILDRLTRMGFEAAAVLRAYKKASKEAQFIKAWFERIGEDDRIHPTYNYYRVVTGRLSSSDPNAQQIPKSAKNAFCASEGKLLVTADYGMIEMRVAAFVADCEPMKQAFREGRDLHIMNGASADRDRAIQTTELLCLWAGVPANRTGCEVLRTVLRDKGPGATREEIQKSVRESRSDWTNQESWSWLWRGSDRFSESSVQGREREFLSRSSWETLRGVWTRRHGIETVGSSYRLQSQQQCEIELADAMLVLSQTNTRLLGEVSGLDWAKIRQAGKAIGFGFLFGMGAPKFVKYADDTYGVTFSEEEAEDARASFFSTWTGLEDWHENQRKYAERYGYVKSPLGRMRRLPAIYSSDNYRRSEAARQAINSPVQSLANDMMLTSAHLIRTQHPYIKPIALVHDAVLCEVPSEKAQESALVIKNIMETGIQSTLRSLGCNFDIPLVADVAVGRNWGSCEDLAA